MLRLRKRSQSQSPDWEIIRPPGRSFPPATANHQHFDTGLAGMNIADKLAKGEPRRGKETISFRSFQEIAPPFKEAAT